MGHEERNCARSRVEVVDRVFGADVGKLEGLRIQSMRLFRVGLVETLWANAEGEGAAAFHRRGHMLHDVGLALEELQVQIVDAVVGFGVVGVVRTLNLWEGITDRLHEGQTRFFRGFVELDDEHPIAGLGAAQHHRAQQTVLFAWVKKAQAVGKSVVPNKILDSIGGFGLQMAGLDVHDLVPKAGDVEAQGLFLGNFLARSNLLPAQPAAGGEAKFQLVSVAVGFGRRYDGSEVSALHLANASQVFSNLDVLKFGLMAIIDMLPTATAAILSVRTSG